MPRKAKAEEAAADTGLRRKKLAVKEAVRAPARAPARLRCTAPHRPRGVCCGGALTDARGRGAQAQVIAAHDRAKDRGRRRAPGDARDLGRAGARGGEGAARKLRTGCVSSRGLRPGCCALRAAPHAPPWRRWPSGVAHAMHTCCAEGSGVLCARADADKYATAVRLTATPSRAQHSLCEHPRRCG